MESWHCTSHSECINTDAMQAAECLERQVTEMTGSTLSKPQEAQLLTIDGTALSAEELKTAAVALRALLAMKEQGNR